MQLERFQMIDSVYEFDLDAQTLKAECTVPKTSPVFEGHFPGHPLMPGVLLIETMAQASGYLVLGLNDFDEMPFLVGVRDAKLRTFVAPESRLSVQTAVDHLGSGFVITKANISHEGNPVCGASLTFKLLPFPAPELKVMVEDHAAKIGLNSGVTAS